LWQKTQRRDKKGERKQGSPTEPERQGFWHLRNFGKILKRKKKGRGTPGKLYQGGYGTTPGGQKKVGKKDTSAREIEGRKKGKGRNKKR